MNIEHLAVYVNDLEGARDFFLRYFGGSSNSGYYNERTGFRSYFISFDSGSSSVPRTMNTKLKSPHTT